MEDFAVVLLFIIIVVIFYYAFTFKTKKEKDYDKHLKENLKDEFIIDPETGAKLTLEQAESGHWVAHDNEFLTKPEKELSKLFSEEEKDAEKALNYLKESREYRKTKFSKDLIKLLEKTKLLSKYSDWSYADLFRIEYLDGYIFTPTVHLEGSQQTYYNDGYQESQLMVWLKFEMDFGHYYFREKSGSEKFFDLIRNDDELKLENYECFTFKKAVDFITLIKLLENFKGQKALEFEFLGQNLFIKNLKYINTNDLFRIEKIIKSFFKKSY